MLFYSRNNWQQNWAQFVLYINGDYMYIGGLWLQLWLKGMEHVPNIFMSFDKYLFLEVINILI